MDDGQRAKGQQPEWSLLLLVVILVASTGISKSVTAQPGPRTSHNGSDVTIRLDPGAASDWTVDENIFGKFFEANGRDAYPGLYAQHLANSSFEPWYVHEGAEQQWGRRSGVLYRDTDTYSGLAYPWEPAGDEADQYEMREGGQHGERYQEVTVPDGAVSGLRQRVALPDERTLAYNLQLSRRGSVGALTIRLESKDGATVFAEEKLSVESGWKRDTVRLELEAPTDDRFQGSPSGEYALSLLAEGGGAIDLDWVMLMPADAVGGMFNPTTVEWLQRFNVTSMRWPGGNWASAYRWEDGVGPIEDRPVRPNLAWDGLEPNYMGTSEFLAFCDSVGLEPLINVGFNEDIPPEEAARWVEYVNGSTDTEMGSLRAEHGHPEPWNVSLWQVGNEVYGSYQIGHTDAEDFAQRFIQYRDAMKEVDPDITVIAAGIDPLYRDWGGNEWNETLFEIAGSKVEAVDIHRYVRGIVNDQNRSDWSENEYLQTMVAFPTQYEDIIGILRTSAAMRGISDLKINVGEWNLQAQVSSGWNRPDYPTMAHASFVAGMYNVFIRQGKAVRYTYQRDNTLYYRPYPLDFRPVNPANYTLEFYAEPFEDGAQWHRVPREIEGPTFDMRQAGIRQQATPDVPYVDAASVIEESGEEVMVYLTNRDLNRTHRVAVDLEVGWEREGDVSVLRQQGDDPFARQTSWAGPEHFSVDEYTIGGDEQLALSMPPASVVRMQFTVREGDRPEPLTWRLDPPQPNPFRNRAQLAYTLEEEQTVRIRVFNVLGQQVDELVPGRKEAGRHSFTWDVAGRSLGSGVYFFQIETDAYTDVTKGVLVQ